jgi:RNA polymerase sigma factor (sigma-70 family)
MKTVIRHLRRAALLDRHGGPGDGQLLEAFLGRHDETAFEALLRRHGPMVLGVCRRVLGNLDDADDAFQATFLVLVRKAATLRSRDLLGNWLHGVAYRTAMKARTMNAKRRAKEQHARERSRPGPHEDAVPEELVAQLDVELNRLPEKYRVPLVLCELEGKSRKEVARLLEVAEGTLSWRLAQAKKLLARRLSRHGVALSGGALAAVLSQGTSSAALSASLLSSTAKAGLAVVAGQALRAGVVPAQVLALAEGVTKAMLLAKLKAVAWVALLGVCVSAGAAYRVVAQEPVQVRVETALAAPQAPDDLEALRLEMEALRKEVRALRERVRTLEAQAGAPKGGGQAPVQTLRGMNQFKVVPIEAKIFRYEKLSQAGADPLADAEAALKKLRQNPNNKQATEALEQAVKRLKEQRKPNQPLQPENLPKK